MVDWIRTLFEHQDKVEVYTKHINVLLKLYEIYKNNGMKELQLIDSEIDSSSKSNESLQSVLSKIKSLKEKFLPYDLIRIILRVHYRFEIPIEDLVEKINLKSSAKAIVEKLADKYSYKL